jgi:hypothetical protein
MCPLFSLLTHPYNTCSEVWETPLAQLPSFQSRQLCLWNLHWEWTNEMEENRAHKEGHFSLSWNLRTASMFAGAYQSGMMSICMLLTQITISFLWSCSSLIVWEASPSRKTAAASSVQLLLLRLQRASTWATTRFWPDEHACLLQKFYLLHCPKQNQTRIS